MPGSDGDGSEFEVARALDSLLRAAQDHQGKVLRQSDLARRSGVSEQTLSGWIKGHNTPRDADDVYKVGRTLAQLAGRQEPTHRQWALMIRNDGRARRSAREAEVQAAAGAQAPAQAGVIGHGLRLAAAPPVPDLPQTFVPRPDIQERAMDLLRSRPAAGPGPVVALIGMSGAGKTLIAQAICSEASVPDRFPDGVLWLDRRRIPGRRACQAEILRALGEDVPEGDPESDLKTLLYRALKDVSCLIVVDDVDDFAQIDAVDAIGPAAALLVTAQDRAVLTDRAEVCPVERVDPDAAREILARYARRAPAVLESGAERVAELCDGLPLALAICGAMAAGPGWDWQQIAELLEHADYEYLAARFRDYPHASLLAAFEMSRANLPARRQQLYTALAVFSDRGPVPAAAAFRLWEASGLGAHQARIALIQLAERSLLTYHRQDDTFELHDLLARYLTTLAGPELAQLHRRLADAYLTAWGGLDAGLPTLDEDEQYGLSHLAAHLARAGDGRRVHDLLAVEAPADAHGPARNRWFDVHDRTGRIAEYLADLALATRLAREATDAASEDAERVAGQVLEMRYALITSSLNGIAASVPIPLLGALVERGVWPAAKAWAYAGTLPSPQLRARALTMLLRVFAGSPEDRRTLIRHALAAAHAIDGEKHADDRGWALAALIPLVAPERRMALFEEAMSAVGEGRRGDAGVWILARLAGHLPDAVEPRLLAAFASEHLMLSDASALVLAARRLPSLRRQVCLRGFGFRFPAARLGFALAVLPFADPEERAVLIPRAQALLAEIAAAEGEPGVPTASPGTAGLLEGLLAMRKYPVHRAQGLVALLPVLGPADRGRAVEAVLEAARDEPRSGSRSRIGEVLPRLCQTLSEDERSRYLGPLLEVVRDYPSNFVAMAPFLADEQLAEAAELAAVEKTDAGRERAFNRIGPYLSEDLLRRTLAALVTLDTPTDRAVPLVKLARRLPEELRLAALEAVAEIDNPGERILALSILASWLPSSAVARARALVPDEPGGNRAATLIALAVLAPEDLRGTIFQQALDAAEAYESVEDRHTKGVARLAADPAQLWAAFAFQILLQDRAWEPERQAEYLCFWAARAPAQLVERAIEFAGGLSEPCARSHTFAALIPCAEEGARAAVLRGTLDAACQPHLHGDGVTCHVHERMAFAASFVPEASRVPIADSYLDDMMALTGRLPDGREGWDEDKVLRLSQSVAAYAPHQFPHIVPERPSRQPDVPPRPWSARRTSIAKAVADGRPALLPVLVEACLPAEPGLSPGSREPDALATGLARGILDVQRWWPGGTHSPQREQMDGVLHWLSNMIDTCGDEEREQWLSEPAAESGS